MKRSLILCVMVLVALVGFRADNNTAAATEVSITLAPDATVRIPIRLWCLDFDKPFPAAIDGTITRPSDAALLALQAALARGATESDSYQTQLAIWRATDGAFHDVAGAGHVLAEQIYSDSLKLSVSPVPTNTLELAVSQGSLKVTIENLKAVSDAAHPELLPYSGTADLVVQNTSSQNVTFIPLDGMVFKPASGTNEQTTIAHLDSTKAPLDLPPTGGNILQNVWGQSLALLLLALGASVLGFGMWTRSAGKDSTEVALK
ncbi:MAG: hypothetical protein WBF31_09730 [Anaerolineae bacterium]